MEKNTVLMILLAVLSVAILILAVLLVISRSSIKSLKKSLLESKQIVTNSHNSISELSGRIIDFRTFLGSDFRLTTTLGHHFVNTAYGKLFFFNADDRKAIENFLSRMYQRLFEEWAYGNFYTKESFYNLVAFEKIWLTNNYVKEHVSQNGNVIDSMCSSLKSAIQQSDDYKELELICSKWSQWAPIDMNTFAYKWQADYQNKAMEFSKEEFAQFEPEIVRFIEQDSHAIGEFETMLSVVMKMNLILERKLLSKSGKAVLHEEFRSTVEPLVERMKSSSTVHQRMTITSQVMVLLEEVNQKNAQTPAA